ncbi:hypothetical protein Tco_1171869 [Tanacetum coccineum]
MLNLHQELDVKDKLGRLGHTERECRSAKRVNDSSYHKDKMLLYKQKEAWVQLSAEVQDWVQDSYEEPTNQELEAHYLYMAKIQELIPAADKDNVANMVVPDFDETIRLAVES